MISALILAAGLSKRMELGNKLLLKRNNVTIIEITYNKIKRSKIKEIIIVLGKESNLVSNSIDDKSAKFILNSNYNEGMASSIKSGLSQISKKSQGVLVCLGDMPCIRTSTYNKIMNEFLKTRKNIIPYYKNKKGNPVLFCRSYFEKLMKIKGDSGAKEIIENNPNDFCVLNIYDKGILEDIDNKEQYNNFIKDEKKY